VIMIGATSNAVNLTDGLDGLATGATILVLAAYVLIANWQLRNDCSVQLAPNCYLVRDPLDVAVVAAAVLGACFGFLWWNAPPAKIFMGDTGSLALGGVLAGLAVTTQTQLLLVILGGLFVIITLSVMIQVGSFKLTGKRVFRMAPLQHHFELIGWAETTIVIRFWLIAGLFVALGLGVFYIEWLQWLPT
jgi:phospho-N-acetylmuramoyl-pentapeptide-transferase